jgi:hypothetical protein
MRKRRFFEQMERLTDAFIQTGAGSNTVRRLYVQALLDQGHFTAALLVLERLITDTEGTDLTENAEAKGLMGRAYKQLYVNAIAPAVKRNQKWLDQAAMAYYGPYKREPPILRVAWYQRRGGRTQCLHHCREEKFKKGFLVLDISGTLLRARRGAGLSSYPGSRRMHSAQHLKHDLCWRFRVAQPSH